MDIEWEKDKHGHWTLIYRGEKKVLFLTPQQKDDLQTIFNSLLNESKSKNLDE